MIDFGAYVTIEQFRFNDENEHYVHKVIGTHSSNCYVDVPVKYPIKESLHNEVIPVANCICCGVNETQVFRYNINDLKEINKKIRRNSI